MNIKEILAAADRIKELVDFPNIVDNERRWYEIERPARLLADACRTRFRPDDDTPIDEAWLLAVGASRSVTVSDAMRLSHDDDIYFVPQHDGSWLPAMQNGMSQWIKLRRITTRGQLRRLCEVLGIKLEDCSP